MLILKMIIAAAICIALTLWRNHTELESKSNGAAELVTGIFVCYGIFTLFDAIATAVAGA